MATARRWLWSITSSHIKTHANDELSRISSNHWAISYVILSPNSLLKGYIYVCAPPPHSDLSLLHSFINQNSPAHSYFSPLSLAMLERLLRDVTRLQLSDHPEIQAPFFYLSPDKFNSPSLV
jgi:hypothetical protein